MDAVSTAVIGWLAGRVLTSGHDRLVRVLRGDRQHNALRKIIRASIGEAVAGVGGADERDLVLDALLREGPDGSLPDARDVSSLAGLVARVVRPRLAVLAEQGYHVGAGRLSAVLADRIDAGLQADAMRDGPLRPLAEWLHHQKAMGQLGEVSQGFRQLLPEAVAAVHTLPADNAAFTAAAAADGARRRPRGPAGEPRNRRAPDSAGDRRPGRVVAGPHGGQEGAPGPR